MNRFNEYFEYDETSKTCLRWKVKRRRIKAGDEAGFLNNTGYWRVGLLGKQFLCHRIVWELHHGVIPAGCVIDHVDKNPQNNQIGNLRLCTQLENNWNQTTNRIGVSSQYKGVHWHSSSGKWRSRIRFEGKSKHLGCYSCEVEAAKAYNVAALQIHGEYASLNTFD